MDALSFLFLLFATLGLLGGVLMLLARNPVHSVLFMLLTFTSAAGMFLLLGAEFIAAIQVLAYSGAILVLFLFVVMLLRRQERTIPVVGQRLQFPTAIAVGLVFLGQIALVMATSAVDRGRRGGDTVAAVQAAGGNVEALGLQLYTTWLLPFEIASVLLLVAAVGALYLAKEDL